MVNKLDSEIINYRLQKIEPPTGKEPDQLIYVLQNKYSSEKIVRITSKDLQSCSAEARTKMCQWLERLIKPAILENIKWMKENKDKCHQYRVVIPEEEKCRVKIPSGRKSIRNQDSDGQNN